MYNNVYTAVNSFLQAIILLYVKLYVRVHAHTHTHIHIYAYLHNNIIYYVILL